MRVISKKQRRHVDSLIKMRKDLDAKIEKQYAKLLNVKHKGCALSRGGIIIILSKKYKCSSSRVYQALNIRLRYTGNAGERPVEVRQ